MPRSSLIIVFLFLLFFPTHPAHAYIDPGAGSYFIQVIIGTFFGLLYTVSLYSKKILTFLKEKFKKKDS